MLVVCKFVSLASFQCSMLYCVGIHNTIIKQTYYLVDIKTRILYLLGIYETILNKND